MINNSKVNFLSEQEGRLLLYLARQALENYFGKKPIELDSNLPANLFQKKGVFVTLKKGKELRGCIGLIKSNQPLYQSICQMALEAAFYDPRFWPLEKEELPDIKIEISVLTKPQKIKSVSEIKLGLDGVIVESGRRRGLFLPQVAQQTGWNLAEFMNHLCTDKTGLPANAWQTGDCEIYTFQAQIFKEEWKQRTVL